LESFFSSASSAGISAFRRATSARSARAAASSLLFLAAPISREAALRRASAASAFWMAARRRSSISISRFASPASPRRASPRSKASGLSRIHLISCILQRPSGESAPPYSASAAILPSLGGGSPTGLDQDEQMAHSAGLAAALAAALALSAAAFFSTNRTDQIEPS